MKSLRVLHLSSEKIWRGGEQQIAYLIEELDHLNVSNFAAVRDNSPFLEYCKNSNTKFSSHPFKNSLDIKTALGIKAICKRDNIDIVHLHSSKSHGIAVLSQLLGNNKVVFVLSRRVSFPPKNSWFTKFKYNFSSIKKIICVSHKVENIIRDYVDEPEKCLTIYDGIDLNKFDLSIEKSNLRKEFEICKNTFIIGNTSALEDEKDYETFIKTVQLLVQHKFDIHAFVIGKGSKELELKELVNELKLDTNITFTGFRNDINVIVPELDLFLMTSKFEGLGSSILDAFLAKVPVVSTNAGGIPEMVLHENTGMITAIGDCVNLAKCIEKIIVNPDFKTKLIENAFAKVKVFDKQSMAFQTLKVYDEILNVNNSSTSS